MDNEKLLEQKACDMSINDLLNAIRLKLKPDR
ncbi:hypothetical protein LCGC14_1964560 [marine sediment metagenome]|uniref:Uncharacterized protein n=1 Tax=marine sediment metagenome TaxID=412755 RepID=A0A0F9FDX9_9ZZZZ